MFAFPSHLCNVVDVVVVVVSRPLHVLSHLPGRLEHKPCARIVRHLNNGNLLRLFAQRCVVRVVDATAVVAGVDVLLLPVLHPVHVLMHSLKKMPHKPALDNSSH